MPYKFNESRRHKIPKARYRVTNWPEYHAASIRRASSRWFTERSRGGVACSGYRRTGRPAGLFGDRHRDRHRASSGIAQPLRQTEGMLQSVAEALGIDIAIPDHTTLSRRGSGLTVLPKQIDRDEPLHLVDSTGLKIYGEGKWLDQQHGLRSRAAGGKCISASMPIRMRTARSGKRRAVRRFEVL